VEVVYLDLLFQIFQEYAIIVGGMRGEAISKKSRMVVKNVPKNPRNHREEDPFYST
jgi:hypothetical protein